MNVLIWEKWSSRRFKKIISLKLQEPIRLSQSQLPSPLCVDINRRSVKERANEIASRPCRPCDKSTARANNLKQIADNAKALGYLFALLAGSRDAHKATAQTFSRLRANLSMAETNR
jgi:hypothetical protein